MSPPRAYREYLPDEDRRTLAESFDSEYQRSFSRIRAGDFVDMIAERIWTEISRGYLGPKQDVAFSNVTPAYTRWVDLEVHLAQERVPIRIDTHDQYLALRTKIVQEIAARAAWLFGRWNGKTSPPPNQDSIEHLRSTLWTKIDPDFPEWATSVCIRARTSAEALELMREITTVTREFGSATNLEAVVDCTPEDFPAVWKKCKAFGIPNTALTFR